MAGSVCKVIIVGNLARDPEIRTLNNGDRVTNLTVATSETWRDKASGERKEKAEFHRVVNFNDNITKVAENYLKKGSSVYLEGKLATRKYEQNGAEKFTTEVVLDRFNGVLVMLGGKDKADAGDGFSGGGKAGMARGSGDRGDTHQGGGGSRSDSYDLNDDIPF